MEQHTDYVEVDIERMYSKDLYRSLCMASSSNSYSICIEYIKTWFLEKFKKDFFKTIYIDGKHVLDDARNLSEIRKLKRLKPSLAIIPNIDLAFDKEKLDSYPFGLNLYMATAKYKDSFLCDPANNVYLGIGLETNLINYTFKVRLSTKAEELDMFKFMKMAFRVGYTQGEEVSMDFHVPYELMLQMAKDLNFYIKDNKIANIQKFLKYLNTHSTIPFLYKYRCINGHSEFFIRLSGLYVHIRSTDITADDGEREGQLTTNYTIEFTCEVRFPAPKFYAYYSINDHEEFKAGKAYETEQSLNSYTIKVATVPDFNAQKWPQYLTTEYVDDMPNNILTIDFKELFEGDIRNVIENSIKSGISPTMFMEIKVFNDGSEIKQSIDWNTMIMTSEQKLPSQNNFISIYTDLSYIQEELTKINHYNETRIN